MNGKEENVEDLRRETKMRCEKFLNELEGLPAGEAGAVDAELTAESREHALGCANCESAQKDFVETRRGLAAMKAAAPGPWFAKRVMQAIAAKELEIEESRNGVWLGVRSLAPRLTAVAALLLVVGGTWAMELRRAERQAMQAGMSAVEELFDVGPSAPLNDDIVASVNEGQAQ